MLRKHLQPSAILLSTLGLLILALPSLIAGEWEDEGGGPHLGRNSYGKEARSVSADKGGDTSAHSPDDSPLSSLSDPEIPRIRALLVGINDYDYPVERNSMASDGRTRWHDLEGAVNDVYAVQEMLLTRYGFPPAGIERLLDDEATHEAILSRIDSFLVAPSRPGDVVFFYFSGHGALLKSGSKEEYDLLDETLVPYDSKLGAADIRDKELRRRFNEILDREAVLTVVLDSCHSGSGARGYPIDGTPKGLDPMWAAQPDSSDASPPGFVPDQRGALVWSATQDDRNAYETWGDGGQAHGAFTLSWLRAIRDSDPRESANFLFRRTRGRLLAEPRYQEPMLDGLPGVRAAPLFGGMAAKDSINVVAVERLRIDGRIELQGGWIHGIDVGSRLRRFGDGPDAPPIYEVTRVLEWGRSIAVPIDHHSSTTESTGESRSGAREISSGTLLEVTNWVAPGGHPLKVWLPTHDDPESVEGLARGIAAGIESIGWQWVEDPTAETPTHVLRWEGRQWQLLRVGQATLPLGRSPSVDTVLAGLRRAGKGSLFVHLPAPRAIVEKMGFGPGTALSAVEPVEAPGSHHFSLAGRLHQGQIEYAWLRAGRISETRKGGDAAFFPVRTPWMSWDNSSTRRIATLDPIFEEQTRALSLARIHAWNVLAAPGDQRFGYRLSIRDPATGEAVDGRPLEIGKRYGITLVKRPSASSAETQRRYVYVFLIDSEGKGGLLYPDPYDDNLKNRHPRLDAPDEIPLEPDPLFIATAPSGTDSYFLLTSAEPIPDPLGVFEFEGLVRGTPRAGMTALEKLLFWTSSSTRGAARIAPEKWSLDRYSIEVIDPAGS